MRSGSQDAAWWKLAMHLDEAQRSLETVLAHNPQDVALARSFQEALREGQARLLEIFRFKGFLPASLNSKPPAVSAAIAQPEMAQAAVSENLVSDASTRSVEALQLEEESAVLVSAAYAASPVLDETSPLESTEGALPTVETIRLGALSKKRVKKDRGKRRTHKRRSLGSPMDEGPLENPNGISLSETTDEAPTVVEESASDASGEEHY